MPQEASLRKTHGAYYTPEHVADFLTSWAVRDARDIVLDPSAGEGVFLFAANQALKNLGGDPAAQLIGIELLPNTCDHTERDLRERGLSARLLRKNFFEVTSSEIGEVDVVIGNPPFIRYQQFAGKTRDLALARAREAGVELSALTSSWAPFLVHAVEFLRANGRLAVVAPAELAHANYAKPVLRHFCDSFRRVSILAFDKRVFPDLSEDTVLVLAEGKGRPLERFTLSTLSDTRDLGAAFDSEISLSAPEMSSGAVRMIEYFLPERTRGLYRTLQRTQNVGRLGDFANIGIGYVTGANDFFHLSARQARDLQVPAECLAPVVRRGSDFRGLFFTNKDWETAGENGVANYLLRVSGPLNELPSSVQRYLARGRRNGINHRYKCRTREPWYDVPLVYRADAFLTYMSEKEPRLVADKAGAFAPNTLHVVRVPERSSVTATDLAVAWQSALSALSCEVEGHSLGGGLLKLEPTEAQRVLVPVLKCEKAFCDEVDKLIRRSKVDLVSEVVDQRVCLATGLSTSDVKRLREGAVLLRERRRNR